MRERIVRWALDLLRFPTVTGREELCAAYLAEELEKLGMTVSAQPVLGAGANLLAARGEGGPWLVTHLDVYPPFEHPDPFRPRLEDGALVGRGAVDAKGQIAALLWALQATEEPVQVALVVDEEELGRGSEALEVPPGVEGAVVLEPTNLRIAIAEAGSVGLEVLVRGKPAHGTTPWAGESAVERAFALYQRLLSAPFMAHRHPLFPKGAWVNLGRVEGGYDTMVVPPHCRMEMDLGFAPGLSAREVLRQTEEAMAEAERIFVTDAWEPWETAEDAKVVRALRRAYEEVLGGPAAFTGMPSWTDAANLVRKGVPTVVFGAGDLAIAHTWHEAVSLAELELLARVLAALIRLWPRV
ncbi:MAG: M20/M25/M40 family metallo-hydrolase [Candidatus Bipolaricaulota bacterium]|nr:M20/M25/M40 family metallo-hydrolase [Candidatus Bipolaricaulota bacterium]MCX7844623.1 M20/M25/M40 family metallo-hydrolase [Candidatus Bipolaricaulota bacterium]MDW8151635.1 M20/M25/M40 family metallo-hydrolase [Candidatus Bipolaricaulota bacterium]